MTCNNCKKEINFLIGKICPKCGEKVDLRKSKKVGK